MIPLWRAEAAPDRSHSKMNLKIESPDIYLLLKHRWQLFGTLTFKSANKPERHRVSMWFALARATARDFRIFFPTLRWCLRMEAGEQTGRLHFHFLLTGIPSDAVHERTCFSMMKRWETLGGGMARVRVFDDRRSGSLDYMEKTLSGMALAGADVYESAKFGSKASELMYSHSMWDSRYHKRISSAVMNGLGKEATAISDRKLPDLRQCALEGV